MLRMFRATLGLATLLGSAAAMLFLFQLLDPAASRHGERLVAIRFAEASNLVPGAAVRTRGVQVGEVRSIDLSPDGTGALVHVAIEAEHATLLATSSRFWVVRPRFEGIARGVDGLDTILKSPYLVFDTPEGRDRTSLPGGRLLIGLDAPPPDTTIPPLQADDLIFSVRFARTYGLAPGSLVVLRDIPVGEARSVELDTSGQWASVELAIRSRYRQTLRTSSVFWIQKPTVQSGWLASNIRADELGSILTGPSISYSTPAAQDSQPLEPGAVLRGQLDPPELTAEAGPMLYVQPKSPTEAGRQLDAARALSASVAGVTSSFDELGLIRTYHYVQEGSVLLLRVAPDRLYAVAPRSLCDGGYVVSDMFSDADISNQDSRIRGSGKSAWSAPARLVWKAEAGADLALLELKGATPEAGRAEAAPRPALDPKRTLQLLAFRGQAQPEFVVLPPNSLGAPLGRGVFPVLDDYAGSLELWQGAIALDEQGRPVGVLGRTGAQSKKPALISLELLPELPLP